MAQRKRKRPTQGSNLKVFYIILAVLAVGGISWIAYSVIGGGSTAAVEPIELAGLEDPQALVGAARGVQVGEANAPVQVLVFSDFTCPACRAWAGSVEQQVKSAYVEPGQVRLVYYDFPLGGSGQHAHGFLAARAARCAEEQGKFWELHDLLFARQSEWSYSRTAPIDQFITYATQVELERDAFSRCLRSDRHADVVTANRLLGDNLGVRATPTIFVGSRSIPDWRDWDGLQAAIQREMGS